MLDGRMASFPYTLGWVGAVVVGWAAVESVAAELGDAKAVADTSLLIPDAEALIFFPPL